MKYFWKLKLLARRKSIRINHNHWNFQNSVECVSSKISATSLNVTIIEQHATLWAPGSRLSESDPRPGEQGHYTITLSDICFQICTVCGFVSDLRVYSSTGKLLMPIRHLESHNTIVSVSHRFPVSKCWPQYSHKKLNRNLIWKHKANAINWLPEW